jgi:N-acetylglutamate synthase-like GNAT family acetyltransferase
VSGPVVIRLATSADLPALRELIPVSVRGLSHAYYSKAQIESAIRHIFGPDTQLVTDGTYFVAESGTELVGCGGWSRRRTLFGGDEMKNEEDPLLDPHTEAARVRAFFVHPDWARRGIGGRILEACANAARAAGFRRAELVATLPGEPLYRACGFEVLERFEAPMIDGQTLPVVRMARTL